jgi:thiosulfate/3-mercaptopyruvate sulfurtransferase
VPSPLVGVIELAGNLSSAPAPLVLDVRWQLDRSDGWDRHRAARIPGSRYVDLETELSGPRTAGSGRHPLPHPAQLAATMAAWGVGPRTAVVVYDDSAGLAAARCWWLLRWAGHADVRLLDGGLAAWTAAGLPLERDGNGEAGEQMQAGERGPAGEDGATVAGPLARAGSLPVLDAAGAAELARRGVLLDARAGERYRGEQEPVDPFRGHIPGALSAPATDNLDGDGRFLAPAALRRRFARLGAVGGGPVGVYCGSGVTAAHEVLALELAGIEAALYPGSWSEWVADPSRPRATGPSPG